MINLSIIQFAIKWLSNVVNQRNLLLLIIVGFLIFNFGLCNRNNTQQKTYEQNIAALTDTIRSYESKTGKLIFERAAFISENNSIKNLNSKLYDEIQHLNDNPIVVIKTNTVVVRDTVEIPILSKDSITWTDTEYTQNFNWVSREDFDDNNYRLIEGNFDVLVDSAYQISTSKMRLTRDELGISLTTGLTENRDGLLEIFVRSDYPGFQPTTLDGALIDPGKSEVLKRYFPPKKWSLGAYAGYGVYVDPINSTQGTGVSIGLGIQYNLIQWNFKK